MSERKVALDDILPFPTPRTRHVHQMASSMHHLGQLHPVIVQQTQDGRYRVLAGRRRIAAARQLGWKQIRAICLPPDASMAPYVVVAENASRKRNLVAEARAVGALVAMKYPHDVIADICGCSRAQVYRLARVATLPEPVLQAVEQGRCPFSAAWQLLKLPEADREEFLERLALGGRLRLREVVQARTENLHRAVRGVPRDRMLVLKIGEEAASQLLEDLREPATDAGRYIHQQLTALLGTGEGEQ